MNDPVSWQGATDRTTRLKIQLLLRNDSGKPKRYLNEQRLVALVLLHRVEDDAWVHEILEQSYPWMIPLLLPISCPAPPTNVAFQWSLIRFMGQLWSRSLASPTPHDATAAVRDAVVSTLGALQVLAPAAADQSRVQAEWELVTCLGLYVTWCRHTEDAGHHLAHLVAQLWTARSAASTTTPVTVHDTTTTTTAAHDTMAQTLTALLDQNQFNVHRSVDEWRSSLRTAWMRLWVQACRGISWTRVDETNLSLPPCVSTALSEWLDRASTRSATQDAHHRQWQAEALMAMILGCTQALNPPSSTSKQAAPQSSTLNQSTDDALVMRLLLASLALNDDRLRTAAYVCVGGLVHAMGGTWLVTRRRGIGNHPYSGGALIRLAVGEYRMQLSQWLDHDGPCDDASGALPLLTACRDILVATVHALEQLCDDMERGTLYPVTGDDLMHVRHSLDEALHVTVQYLGLQSRRHDAVDRVTMDVLGALLVHVSAFEAVRVSDHRAPHGTTPDSAREYGTVSALSRAMHIAVAAHHEHTESIEALLPSVATTLIVAEGDGALCGVLDEYQVLGATLAALVQGYFDAAPVSTVTSSTPWASQIVELWMDMGLCHNPTPDETRCLQASIIAFMKRMLRKEHTLEFKQALSTTVGAFIALQGPSVPSEHDAMVIKDVLLFRDS